MRFRDRKHQQQVQSLERTDPMAQALIAEFCELLNIPYQQQQGFFAAGFYQAVVSERDALEPQASAPPAEKLESPKIEGSAPPPGMF